ncbi:MAG: hypothetical protein AAGG38_14830 [Planctomycetota bacterium]
MSPAGLADGRAARALATLGPFAEWRASPLPADLETRLARLTEQELMTAAAVCLLRVAQAEAA